MAPTQEMSDARQAVQAAHEAGAEKYAPENVRNAEALLNVAEKKLAKRSFKAARHEASLARGEAVDALNIAKAMEAANRAMENAAAKGVLSEQAKKLFHQAEQAIVDGNDEMAIALARKAQAQAEGDLARD